MKYPSVDFTDIQITTNASGTRVEKCVIEGVEGKRFDRASNRVVFHFGKFVVKFDSAHGLGIQNDKEAANYKKIADADKQYFAAVLRQGTVKGMSYLVQEYVKTTRRAFKRDVEPFKALKEKYRISDMALSLSKKENHHNVAFNSKGFKIFDLGYEKFMLDRSDDKFEGNPNQGELWPVAG